MSKSKLPADQQSQLDSFIETHEQRGTLVHRQSRFRQNACPYCVDFLSIFGSQRKCETCRLIFADERNSKATIQ